MGRVHARESTHLLWQQQRCYAYSTFVTHKLDGEVHCVTADLRPSLEMETASRHKPVIIYPKDMVQKHNGVRIRCTTTPSSAVSAFSTAERKLSNCQQFVCR